MSHDNHMIVASQFQDTREKKMAKHKFHFNAM